MELHCRSNKLTHLDVSNKSILTHLGCSQNHLISLDVSNATSLYWLDCHDNRLKHLNVTGASELSHLFCNINQLTSLANFVTNENLGSDGSVDIRYNYLGSEYPEAVKRDIQILTERIGEPSFQKDFLEAGFAYEPQKEMKMIPPD